MRWSASCQAHRQSSASDIARQPTRRCFSIFGSSGSGGNGALPNWSEVTELWRQSTQSTQSTQCIRSIRRSPSVPTFLRHLGLRFLGLHPFPSRAIPILVTIVFEPFKIAGPTDRDAPRQLSHSEHGRWNLGPSASGF